MCASCVPHIFVRFAVALSPKRPSWKQSPLYALEIVAADKRREVDGSGLRGVAAIQIVSRRGGVAARCRLLGKLTIQVRTLASASTAGAELFSAATPREYEHGSLRLILRAGESICNG
jgi:hypothetical protein